MWPFGIFVAVAAAWSHQADVGLEPPPPAVAYCNYIHSTWKDNKRPLIGLQKLLARRSLELESLARPGVLQTRLRLLLGIIQSCSAPVAHIDSCTNAVCMRRLGR